MKPSSLLPVAVLLAAFLSSCAHFEQVRLRSQGPSPDMDHCVACTDLGQAWALWRMGHYDQVEEYCRLVIEAEPSSETRHAFRARDLSNLAQGSIALRERDFPLA